MRVGLRDDFGQVRCAPEATAFSSLVALDGDPGGGCGCNPAPEPETPPVDATLTLTVSARSRVFYDADGTPKLEWTEVAEAEVLLFETRSELNDATGQTLVKATAVIPWADGTPTPGETAVGRDSRGRRWEITSAEARPGRLELKMEYLDDAE